MRSTKNIRNIAIIAHVDHGKTTLVDSIFQITGAFRDNQQVNVRVLDSNPQERERGITIFSKNAAAVYKDHKINIVDTPGHADFGGEVERILQMVDGVLLLVDAFEGPMPQTKFVLRKALELHLKPIVVINKIDRPQSDPVKVHDQVLDLFIALGAEEHQLDFPYIFTSAKNGIAKYSMDDPDGDMCLLLDMIVKEIPSPVAHDEGGFQMLVTTLDYSDYIGKIAIGRIHRGKVSPGSQLVVVDPDGVVGRGAVTKVFLFDKLQKIEAKEATSGDIIAVAGIPIWRPSARRCPLIVLGHKLLAQTTTSRQTGTAAPPSTRRALPARREVRLDPWVPARRFVGRPTVLPPLATSECRSCLPQQVVRSAISPTFPAISKWPGSREPARCFTPTGTWEETLTFRFRPETSTR